MGGQAAAAAHSLNTPLSTIKIISQELYDQFKDKKEIQKDLELLVNQVERCSQILKRLSLNPGVEDELSPLYVTESIQRVTEAYHKLMQQKLADECPYPLPLPHHVDSHGVARLPSAAATECSSNKEKSSEADSPCFDGQIISSDNKPHFADFSTPCSSCVTSCMSDKMESYLNCSLIGQQGTPMYLPYTPKPEF